MIEVKGTLDYTDRADAAAVDAGLNSYAITDAGNGMLRVTPIEEHDPEGE